jgi:hypothetical protein
VRVAAITPGAIWDGHNHFQWHMEGGRGHPLSNFRKKIKMKAFLFKAK